MKKNILFKAFLKAFFIFILFSLNTPVSAQRDTSYISIAPPRVLRLLEKGKPPVVTLQLSGYFNIGLLDLAANDNTIFNKSNYENGRNFGTRYGYGIGLTGKIALNKKGYVRLNISPSYQRLLNNFVISNTSNQNVSYNVFSGGIGIENSFTPYRPFKPYIGFDIIGSIINGHADLTTDSGNFHLDIKNSFRIGFAVNFGFEYAFNDKVGINLGTKLTHADVLLRDSKTSSNPNEVYLNDKNVVPQIPYSGWRQFFFGSFYAGINYYIGMKNKK